MNGRLLILAAVCAGLVLAVVLAACGDGVDIPPARRTPLEDTTMAISISSDAFGPNEPIPARFSCDGENLSPALSWGEAPEGTQSFALIVDDPDAPGGDFTHWVLFDLPVDADGLPEGVEAAERPEVGGVQGSNDFGNIGYGGPCPPPGGPHRYRFNLYALDGELGLEPGASKGLVVSAIQGRILAEGQLIGVYQR